MWAKTGAKHVAEEHSGITSETHALLQEDRGNWEKSTCFSVKNGRRPTIELIDTTSTRIIRVLRVGVADPTFSQFRYGLENFRLSKTLKAKRIPRQKSIF